MSTDRHPKGLYVLFATEMWERFSFYTMIALFTLYLSDPKDGFGWSKADATGLYANYLMFVYASPLIGGWIADKKLGFRKTITIGGIFFIFGHVLLAFPSEFALYSALTCLVVGNGCFKPNISSMVGNLYPPGSPLRDSAYNIFYMGINIGAALAPVVAEGVRQRFGFHPAFVVAGGGMVIGMIIFWSFQKWLAAADKGPKQNAIDSAINHELDKPVSALDGIPEWRRITALIVVFLIVIVFWMAFHQNGSTLTYWADKNTDWASDRILPTLISIFTLGMVSGKDVSGVISNAINPFWIVTLSYPLSLLWPWLNKRKLEPSTPAKMAIGILLSGFAFLLLYFGGLAGGDTGKVSPWWIVIFYFILSLGELLLSPMGLSLVSKVAPVRLKGVMMGGWFVATAIGNKLTMIGKYWDVWPHSQFFLLLASILFGASTLLFLLLRPLKKAMPGV
jgi:POT family proton-dependent oligopeptide transporter